MNDAMKRFVKWCPQQTKVTNIAKRYTFENGRTAHPEERVVATTGATAAGGSLTTGLQVRLAV